MFGVVLLIVWWEVRRMCGMPSPYPSSWPSPQVHVQIVLHKTIIKKTKQNKKLFSEITLFEYPRGTHLEQEMTNSEEEKRERQKKEEKKKKQWKRKKKKKRKEKKKREKKNQTKGVINDRVLN